MPAPNVTVAAPKVMTVTDYEYFTGRVEASSEVEIRSRVTGFVKTVDFKPGAEVKAGDLLVTVDDRTFLAEKNKAQALLTKATVEKELKKIVRDREEKLRAQNASSEDALLQAKADYDAAVAAEELAKAELENATVNFDYCRIFAPLDGQIGESQIDPGDLISGGPSTIALSTGIARIVSVDEVKIAFEVDEQTVQRLQQMMRDGMLETSEDTGVPVEFGLAIHGQDYPVVGEFLFRDNMLNAQTGTMLVKATAKNPKPERGPRLLTPGMFVRVRLPIGKSREVRAVPEAAFMSSRGNRFLYILGPDNIAQRMLAVVGGQHDGMREVISVAPAVEPGDSAASDVAARPLTDADQVIVRGLQRVRNGKPVAPEGMGATATP